jgi:hypothetical protein
MATIVLPAIESSAKPLPSDVMAAEDAILAELGGVGPTGAGALTVRLGNLDDANIAAGAGFTNSHKREPFSRTMATVPLFDLPSPGKHQMVYQPVDLLVERCVLSCPSPTALRFKGVIEFVTAGTAVVLTLPTSAVTAAGSDGVLDTSFLRYAEWPLSWRVAAGTWLRARCVAEDGYDAWYGDLVLWGKTIHG